VAIAAGYFKLFKGNRAAGKFIENLWLHSVGTALVAGKLGTEGNFSFSSETYVAGLLHDLGKFFFATFYPDIYLQVRKEISQSTTHGLDLEKHIFGINHLDAAQELSIRWKIPPRIATVTTFHHHPLSVETDTQSLTTCIAIANVVSHGALKDEPSLHESPEVDQWWEVLQSQTKRPEFRREVLEPALVQEAVLARQFANILTSEAQELGES
jgi:HD-like signal output (HDOD) protein